MGLDKGWIKTIDDGMADPLRGQWDPVVKAELKFYNTLLAATPGYISVDSPLVIAMLWVESGGPKGSHWSARVMQIGNPKDKGWPTLKGRKEATDIVVRKDLLATIDAARSNDLDKPMVNIQLGIAYLFVRMVYSDIASVQDAADGSVHTYTVKPDDNAFKIAKQEGTTESDLRSSNPGIDIGRLKVGQELKFHKAHMARVITGWRVFDAATIADRYNGGGDSKYADKLRHVVEKLKGK